MLVAAEDRSEIAFFDLETTVPTRPGQGFSILEFGAILVCPRKLVELHSYSTLVRPADLSHISTLSVRCNGITKDAVVSAPKFADIADVVYDILHGRVWAGHNILRFDCVRIREAFAEINRPAPEPKGTIDSLALLTEKFGRRAGDMKMATLAAYFGLGKQTHRSLDDVRMNLEVLKYCAAVLFLESSLPDVFPENSWVSPNATTRSRSNRKNSREQIGQNESTPSSSVKVEYSPTLSPPHHIMEENHPILSLMSPNTGEVNPPLIESNPPSPNSSNMETETESGNLSENSMQEENTGSTSKESSTSVGSSSFNLEVLRAEIENEALPDDNMKEESSRLASEESPTSVGYERSYICNDFLEPEDISLPSISVTLVPFFRGIQKIQILHRNLPLQLQCLRLKVRFGISAKFVDQAGRPRLSIVVNAPPSLCDILDRADSLAQKLSVDSGSSSEWRHVVTRKPGFFNSPTVRLHLPTVADGEITRLGTEIHQKDGSSTQRLVFSRFDVVELDSLFTPGNLVDAYFSLDAYDYQQNAGLRLVMRKLIIHPS